MLIKIIIFKLIYLLLLFIKTIKYNFTNKLNEFQLNWL